MPFIELQFVLPFFFYCWLMHLISEQEMEKLSRAYAPIPSDQSRYTQAIAWFQQMRKSNFAQWELLNRISYAGMWLCCLIEAVQWTIAYNAV